MNKTRGKKPDFVVNQEGIIEATPERFAKAGDAVDDFTTDTGRTIRRVSAIDWLYSSGRIDGDCYRAGYRILDDWYVGGLAQRCTADPSREFVDGGGHADSFAVRRMDAARRYAEASGDIGPVHMHPIAEMVLGESSPKEYGQKFFRINDQFHAASAAKAVLQRALEALALHYAPQERERQARMRVYRPPDAKPRVA